MLRLAGNIDVIDTALHLSRETLLYRYSRFYLYYPVLQLKKDILHHHMCCNLRAPNLPLVMVRLKVSFSNLRH